MTTELCARRAGPGQRPGQSLSLSLDLVLFQIHPAWWHFLISPSSRLCSSLVLTQEPLSGLANQPMQLIFPLFSYCTLCPALSGIRRLSHWWLSNCPPFQTEYTSAHSQWGAGLGWTFPNPWRRKAYKSWNSIPKGCKCLAALGTELPSGNSFFPAFSFILLKEKLSFAHRCYSQLRSSLGLWLQYLLLMGCQGPRQFNSKHVVRIHSLLNYVLTALSCGAQRGGCKDKQAGICHIWGLPS